MNRISLIAVVDRNFGLGKNNQLLCHLPADLKLFKQLTLNKPVIMGRKTFQSIGKPLPQRHNIVLTTQLLIDGVQTVNSLEDAFALTKQSEEVMIIGGASIYEQAFSKATDIYLTVINHQFEADVFFPRFAETKWHCISQLEKQRDEKNQYDMTFYHYQLK